MAVPGDERGRGYFDRQCEQRGQSSFGAAAQAMRRILVENARRKGRLKHGGDLQRNHLTTLDIAITSGDERVLALDEALEKLAARRSGR